MIRTGRCGVGSEQGGIERHRRAGGARAVAERVWPIAHRPCGRRRACQRARRPVCSLPRVHLTLARHERREKIAAAGRARAAAALVAAGARECMARARAHLESPSCSSRPVVILCARTTRPEPLLCARHRAGTSRRMSATRWERSVGSIRQITHRCRGHARIGVASQRGRLRRWAAHTNATRAARSAKCRRLT